MSVPADHSPFSAVYQRIPIFAFDVVYFIARECRTNWAPHSRSHYFIDRLSPDIQNGARAILRNREHIFQEKYKELVPPGTSANEGIFHRHAEETFNLFLNRYGTPEEFFNSMVYVARLGIMFYQQGVREAPELAVVLIGESLRCYMQRDGLRVLPQLQVIGRNLAQKP